MTAGFAVAIVIAAALFAANWPFVTRRWFVAVPLKADKGIGLRLAELVAMYLIVGGLGMLLERHLGQNAAQGWEFYAITFSLFVTLAFPGFVVRHLVKRRKLESE
jgi:hypothetical protein